MTVNLTRIRRLTSEPLMSGVVHIRMESTYKLVPVPLAAGVARNRILHDVVVRFVHAGHALLQRRADGSSSCAYPERAQGSHDLKLGSA